MPRRRMRIARAVGIALLAACGGSGSGPNGPGLPPSGSTVPAAPSGLTAKATSWYSMSLTWQDNSSDETGFVLERKTGADGSFAPISFAPPDATSVVDPSCDSSTTYTYRIRARNAAGFSAYSADSIATTPSIGTVWAKRYAGPGRTAANAIRPTSDGGFIVGGSLDLDATAVANQGAWAMKIGSDGVVAWSKTYGGFSTSDGFEAVRQTAEGGFVLAGGMSGDAWVVKVDANGAILWQKRYGRGPEERAYDIVQTDDDGDGTRDDGFIVAGSALDSAWVLKIGADGALEWEHTYGAFGASSATAVRQTPDGGYAVTGYTFAPGTNRSDIFVLRLQQDGKLSSLTTYPLADRSWGQDIEVTSDGGLIVTGYTDTSATSAITDEVWLLKLAADGSIDWQKSYGDGQGALEQLAFDVEEKPGGGYLVAGSTTDFGASSEDFWLLEVDPSGAIVSQRRYGGLGGETAAAAALAPDGVCVLAGRTGSFSPGAPSAAWIVSLDSTRSIVFDPLTNATTAATTFSATGTAAAPTIAPSVLPIDVGIRSGVDTTVEAADSKVTVTIQSR
jgi:Fibronectin type III domain